jgi:hypothetical protein
MNASNFPYALFRLSAERMLMSHPASIPVSIYLRLVLSLRPLSS